MILVLLVVIIAISQAIEDILQYKHHLSIFSNAGQYSFWGKDSWIRKYKYGNHALGPKFFGSTTFLIWLTDGWHMVKMIWMVTVFVAIVFLDAYTQTLVWYYNLLEVVVLLLVYGSVFELFYRFILRKK